MHELAHEAFEDIMGFVPSGVSEIDDLSKAGHKPARADIQKMKDVFDLYGRARPYKMMDLTITEDKSADTGAKTEWDERFMTTNLEKSYLRAYSVIFNEYGSAQYAFNGLSAIFDSVTRQQYEHDADGHQQEFGDPILNVTGVGDDSLGDPSPEAKKAAGALLKKNEESNLHLLYPAIWKGLDRLRRNHPESYKLFPWFVKQMKANYTKMLGTQAGSMPPLMIYEHAADIVGEAGKVLSQLRADNQIPQDFDINKLNLEELEKWLMQWKRDNREVEAQGKVVYEFHNKWTIQKLESPEALQFEGDEMGHCVGGYSHQVESGHIGVYSLRDDKGMPHVTMEMENPVAYKSVSQKPIGEFETEDLQQHMPDLHARHKAMPHFENEEQAAEYRAQYHHHPDETRDKWPDYLHEPAYPTAEDPDAMKDMYDFEGVPLKTEFGIVQIQGKGNKMPKPEYQHMMKEFLDSLREQGSAFERADNWYGNWDEPYGDAGSDEDPSTYRELTDWYEQYQADHHSWQQPKEDVYGLPADRKTVTGGFIDEVIENTMYGLSNVYDRSKEIIFDWAGAAQMIYHLMNTQYLQEKVNTPERKEAEKKSWLDEIQSAEEKLSDWGFDHNNWEYIRERTEEKMVEEAESHGINLDNYEDEMSRIDWNKVEEEHEDVWNEVRDGVQEEDENDTYGDCWKFIRYLYNLVYFNGHVGPGDMPDPNQSNAGLPSPDVFADSFKIPGTLSKVKEAWVAGPSPRPKIAASPYQVVPIDQTNNIWFDEDGQSHQRYRPGWAKDETGKMKQTGQDEDTFLDLQGRQGQGVVAYHGNKPVGSLTWVEDANGQNMMGSAYVHPDHREKGLFNQMSAGLRSSGRPTDAYVWNNPWLKNKVRDWTE